MTYKNITTNEYRIAQISTTDTYGGQDFHLTFSTEMIQLIEWWKNWKPVFDSKDPSVMDALQQARVLHEINK